MTSRRRTSTRRTSRGLRRNPSRPEVTKALRKVGAAYLKLYSIPVWRDISLRPAYNDAMEQLSEANAAARSLGHTADEKHTIGNLILKAEGIAAAKAKHKLRYTSRGKLRSNRRTSRRRGSVRRNSKSFTGLDSIRLLSAFQVLSLPSGTLGVPHERAREVIAEMTGKAPQRGVKFHPGASLEDLLAIHMGHRMTKNTSRRRGSVRRNSRRRTSLRRNGMRSGTEREFAAASSKAGEVRRMSTKRSFDAFYSDRGTEVASKHQTLTRGKVTSTSYMVNTDYLPSGFVANSRRRGSRRLRRNSGPRPLYGHTSMATAYLVDDYPYGYNQRTQIRYWLEHKKGKGYRFMSQTMDPKRHVWNKPKASTYLPLAAVMYLDGNGHVKWTGLGMYSKASDVADFIRDYPGAVNADVKGLADAHIRHHTKLAKMHEEGLSGWLINGVPTALTESDIKRILTDLDEWSTIRKML
jgi:hypothetical protein